MDDIRDCYEVLELDYDVPLAQVEKAYRELTKVWHPDRFLKEGASLQKKAGDKQRQINAAYRRLQSRLPLAPARSRGTAGQEIQVAPVSETAVASSPVPASAPLDSPLVRVRRFLVDCVGPVLRDAVLPAVVRALSTHGSGGASMGARNSWGVGAGCDRPRRRQKTGRGPRGPGRGQRGGPGRGRG